jgi:hypothetical protein
MKKLLTLGLGAAMALCAVSCSQDEELAVTEPQGFVSETGEAYVNIKISTPADAVTRAGTSDEGFEYGTSDEQTIKSARFFFFNAQGQFIKEGLIYKDGGGTANTASPTENVEYMDKKLVLLVNIGSESPAYVITVANPPADLDKRIGGTNSITDVENILEGSYYTEGTSNGATTKNFIMSTTSYINNDATGNEKNYYYVTPINGVGVYSSAAAAQAADASVLDIYIERLAVKVGVTINKESASLNKGEATGENTYQLLSDDNKPVTIVGDSDNTPVYVNLIAWGINATTRQSYLFKHLDTSWSKTINGFEWNDPSNYRSYWGKSFNYGDATFNYPLNYHSNVVISPDTVTSVPWLLYIPSAQVDNSFGSVDYCMENTNTTEIIKKHYNSASTAVLVKARIVKKDGSEFKENIVKYGTTLYTYKAYAEYVVKALEDAGGLKYFTGGTQLSTSDVEVVSAEDKRNGRIYVQLTSTAKTKAWVDKDNKTVDVVAINKDLSIFNASSDALGYTRGLMYYSIPIRHLGAIGKEEGVESDYANKLFETYLGIVRNHYYKLEINSLKGVGHGIVNPDEPIVPNPVEDTGYYLNAKINVLSWKVVSQSVDLGSK